jgi:hypothetical protein
MTVTGQQVLEAFKLDPHVTSPNDPQLQLMEPYIRALPEILADDLDKLVTFQLLYSAKLRFLQYCRDGDMFGRASTVHPDLVGADSDIVDTLRASLDALIEEMVELEPKLSEILAAQGLTEDDLFAKVGLNDALQALHQAGTLTLGDLLATQPGVLIVNES